MNEQEYIPIGVFCEQYGVAIGLIEIITVEETICIPVNQLKEAEKLLRLHNELEINLQGIDVVTHLLQRIQEMQHEIQSLRNKLHLYEDPE
jgi:chaperone modulatory protein CbpM